MLILLIDIKTLALVIAFGNLTFGILATIYNASSQTFNPSLSMFRWAKLASGFGMLLLVSKHSFPAIFSFNLSHVFLFSGWGLEFFAYCLFLKRTSWQRPILFSTVFIILLFQVFDYFEMPNTLALSTFFGGLIHAGMAFVFLSHRVNHALILRFIGLIDLAGATVFFYRTAERFSVFEHLPSLSPTSANALLYSIAFFAMIINSFGFLLVVKQADELQLQQAFEQLQQAEAEQRQLLAMATHEFRTPLSVIDSSAQLLAVTLPPDAQTQKMLDRIRRGVKRLVHFLDNCLTEDRLDNRALIVHADKVDLNQLAAWGLENAELISSAHKIRLDLAPHLPVIEGDKHLLKVLLINLLSNAIKFSKPDADIFLRIQTAGEKIVLSVCDEGQGIPADELPLVTQKYMRGRAAGTISGAGLGLSLVARIVELHHGHFSISSTVGKGTTLQIELPQDFPQNIK